MTKDTIKEIIAEYQRVIHQISFIPREIFLEDEANYVFVGLRHAGKSYLMYQRIHELISKGHSFEEFLYFNFEDDRLENIQLSDLDLIKTCFEEMYDHKPIFFLDEIQVVTGWEKFARRLADQKYRVYITGSNAKMLSSEIATTLGGRFLIQEVYPFSFKEFLKAKGITANSKGNYHNKKDVVKKIEEYFTFGGLPEIINIRDKRSWISSLYNNIFFGDLVTRHQIRNDFGLKILIRKLAESVKQPASYNRMANIVSTCGKKLTTDAVIDYIAYMKESWLILSIENYNAKLQEKESNKKYYFIDNGILNLFLMDGKTSLLENIVAIDLYKRFGEEVYFYKTPKAEVDFLVPSQGLAIQVCYSIDSSETELREVSAFASIPDEFKIQKKFIITKDYENAIETGTEKIEVIPFWKWLLKF